MPKAQAEQQVKLHIKDRYNIDNMEISKAHWVSEGRNVHLSMPIAKVDTASRIVSGFATLDNIDRQDDIVPATASMKAFSGFRGNIREMHQPLAVGKVVSFKEDQYFDQETKKFYNGVYVSAYVSKGAEDTWQKVLDGTLTGFSIGGSVKDYENTYDEELGKAVRIIKDYELYELSLVDSPANQFANVISIEKNHSSGYLAKALIENVYWCGSDNVVQLSSSTSSDCPRCDKGMKNIGFVESNDVDKADVVKAMLSTINNEKEVSKMDEINETPEETVEKAVDSAEVVETIEKAEEAVAEEVVEKAAKPEDDEEDASEPGEGSATEDLAEGEAPEAEDKAKKDVSDLVDITKLFEETTSGLITTISTLADTVKSLVAEVDSIKKGFATVESQVSAVKDEFGKRVDAVEQDTAFRKSGDLGEIVQEESFFKAQEEVSKWGGVFLKKSDLYAQQF